MLFLPLACGCSAARKAAAKRPRDAAAAEATSEKTGKNAARARYSAAVAMDLKAAHLEELYTYQNLSLGTKQPSLIRDARRLRYDALAALDEALEFDPGSPAVIRRKGDILLEMGRVDEALKLFGEAEAVASAEPRWYFRTGGQLEMLNRLSEAAKLLSDAAGAPGRMPDHMRAVAFVELGSLYVRLDRLEEAEAAYRQALDLSEKLPSASPAVLSRALAASLKEDPTAIRRTLVSVLKRRGKLEEALEEAMRVVRDAPADPRAVLVLSSVYEAMGRAEQVVSVVEDFVTKNPSNRACVLALMNILASRDRVDEAVARGREYLDGHGGKDAKVQQAIMSVLRKAGRTAEAEKFALSIGESGALDVEVVMTLLDLYAAEKRVSDAFALGQEILQREESDPKTAQDVFGLVWSRLSPEEAEKLYGEYSAAYPEDLDAVCGYARWLRSKGNSERSGDLFVELADKDAPYSDAYEAAAARYLATGYPYEAISALLEGVDRGLASQPDAVAARILQSAGHPGDLAARLEGDVDRYKTARFALCGIIARLYAKANNNAQAEKYYRKALESSAPSLSDWAGFVVTLYRQDKNAEAIEVVQKLRTQGQGIPPLVRMLITMLSKDGKYEEALALACDLIREQPTDIDNHVALANLYIEKGNYDGAHGELVIARDLAEGDDESMIDVRYLLGIIYEEQGKLDEAVSTWRENLRTDPSDADSNNAIAYHIAEHGGDYNEALELARKALAGDEENAAYLDTLGWIYYKMGELETARAALGKASSLDADPVIFEHLGDVLLATGDAKGAVEAWNKALSNDPRGKDRARIEEKAKANSSEVK